MATCPGSSGCLFRLLDGASVSALGCRRAIWGVVLRPAGLAVGPSATEAQSEDGGQILVIRPDRFLFEPVKSHAGSVENPRRLLRSENTEPPRTLQPHFWVCPEEPGARASPRRAHRTHGPLSHGSHEVEQPRCPCMDDGLAERGPSARATAGEPEGTVLLRIQWDAVDPTHVGPGRPLGRTESSSSPLLQKAHGHTHPCFQQPTGCPLGLVQRSPWEASPASTHRPEYRLQGSRWWERVFPLLP